ncbi:hypothetical protein ['Chrysanthemum coronarium' phytoplasma]|uniref:Uncharacterized protein n=1 Tax='Chrysanthemum coronarium' phytoplasma TaxID=1520703 RepID=A0ABQ0J3J0_9MOLU|nr:hypothetical protein ['Chrysanthemum coronarium' phytoplasma]GAK74168.1 putative uncharacterized protein ['Chrysanthemum coronarium' phytoplasma]
MNNKKRKIILIVLVVFISIILLILLFLLGLRLPKLFKSIQDKNKVETQSQYQTQYIHDTNKVNNIIGLINALKHLKQLKESKNKKQNKEQKKQEEAQYQFDWNSNYDNDDNKLVKDIAVVSLTIGAGVISCVVLTPIFASVGPIAAPLALLL